MLQSRKGIRLTLAVGLLAMLGGTNTAYSQDIKYEDLYARLSGLNPVQAYTQLFAFQQQNPYFSNTYVQLGYVCEQKLREVDPLRDFEQANYWANNAVLFYNLFPVYLKDGDVRRHREYYANLPIPLHAKKKVEQEDALAFLQERLSRCKSYKDTLALIYGALDRSKGHYNACVQLFNTINVDYRSLNEALLRTNSGLLNRLDTLDSHFTRSIGTFKAYQSLIAKFPVGSYRQEYTVKPIETFRLDGITNSDFLNNSFFVWDYGRWVAEFRETFSRDIVPLRKEITGIQEQFLANRRRLSLIDTLQPNEQFSAFDDFFLFRLGKYDNSSIVRTLFEYHNAYQNLLIRGKSPLNSPTDSAPSIMNRKLRYYHRLSQEHAGATKALAALAADIDSAKVLNHKEFFDRHYNGLAGLLAFPKAEEALIAAAMNDNFSRLKDYLSNEQTQRARLGYSSGRQKVPLYPNFPPAGETTKEPFVVYNVSYLTGSPVYVGGYMNRSSRKPKAFVAKVDTNRTVAWVREVGLPGAERGDYAKLVYGIDNGCVALVTNMAGETTRSTYVRHNIP